MWCGKKSCNVAKLPFQAHVNYETWSINRLWFKGTMQENFQLSLFLSSPYISQNLRDFESQKKRYEETFKICGELHIRTFKAQKIHSKTCLHTPYVFWAHWMWRLSSLYILNIYSICLFKSPYFLFWLSNMSFWALHMSFLLFICLFWLSICIFSGSLCFLGFPYIFYCYLYVYFFALDIF